MGYKLEKKGGVINTDTNSHIPFFDGNSDYEAYKLWLAEGNTPDPAQTPEEIAAEQAADAQAAEDEVARKDAKGMPFLNFLATHNNTQIRNRVQTLAVDQAGIVDVLEKLAVAVAIQARKELR